MVKTSELRVKDCINLTDGRRLGLIGDLELNLAEGRVEAVVIPGPARFLGLGAREPDVVIPWHRILKVGVDVILVRTD
ncbi:essential sporulation protein [Candidatus Hydrogenisulfobacillus filiaventi]|uniref:Essential sporulation protein n=1 Tax=Candidatus Hydrogenisulfobacillus filiaventi TaxID=2707344 RepID=A0A6F8ZFC1_9FIRM|nr:YlmC/YmxH family sporulation protein [Bacillota bacterium]CAB1128477.1 essential sporulation protein [Candidatus Hydrogenisulfobacillus filiaventi]